MLCLVCGSDAVSEQLSVGSHPVATFYRERRDDAERKVRLALGQCSNCGTIQSTDIVPHEALIPPYDWLFAREPEEHLDEVVDNIMALPGIGPHSVVGALTYKDDTTVDRLIQRGCASSWRVTLDGDLGIANPAANIETVQKLTTPETMAAVATERGQADVLVVRHIFEHTEDPIAFAKGLAELVKPGGILMLEVPDCTTSLRLNDYCMIWEEHSLYLTPETFAPIASLGGFETIRLDVYPLPFENSMVLLARKTDRSDELKISADSRNQIGLMASYAAAYDPACRDLRVWLEQYRREKGPIALFGAGHLACAFANFMGVAEFIDFVADDTPQKQGKFLPGTNLEILPSQALVERGVSLCLLALSISNEDKVIKRNTEFANNGGTFRSVFRASRRSIFDI
jgi:hypothetical protein